jgi:hypothetical protein
LSFLYGATKEFDTSLRLEFTYCSPAIVENWTYPYFVVQSSATNYTVQINQTGYGTTDENWRLGWRNGVGPAFSTIDKSSAFVNSATEQLSCPSINGNTGFWFSNNGRDCGLANLNGERYDCSQLPPADNAAIFWGHDYDNPPSNVHMKIRPSDIKNYDSGPETMSTIATEEVTTTVSGQLSLATSTAPPAPTTAPPAPSTAAAFESTTY